MFSKVLLGGLHRINGRKRRNGAYPRMRPRGRRWAAGKNCRCLMFHDRRPSSPLFPCMRRTIPPVTIGTGGISYVQRQISTKSMSLTCET